MSNDKTMYCCNEKAVYVDNVPGKEYYFCKSCKNEVLTPISLEAVESGSVGWNGGDEVDFLTFMPSWPSVPDDTI